MKVELVKASTTDRLRANSAASCDQEQSSAARAIEGVNGRRERQRNTFDVVHNDDDTPWKAQLRCSVAKKAL